MKTLFLVLLVFVLSTIPACSQTVQVDPTTGDTSYTFKAGQLYTFKYDATLYTKKVTSQVSFKDSLKSLVTSYFANNDSVLVTPVIQVTRAVPDTIVYKVNNFPSGQAELTYYNHLLIEQVEKFQPWWKKTKTWDTFGTFVQSLTQ